MRLMSIILLFIVVTLFATCKKKDPPIGTNATTQLPPITTTGENTFGCLVNGEVWLPKGKGIFAGLNSDYFSLGVTIQAKHFHTSGGSDYIAIGIYKDYLDATLPIELNMVESQGVISKYSCSNQNLITDTIIGGKLNLIRSDTINEIFSGTFEFTVVDSQCDTIKITNGRFDIKD